jgi:hypothetical protein
LFSNFENGAASSSSIIMPLDLRSLIYGSSSSNSNNNNNPNVGLLQQPTRKRVMIASNAEEENTTKKISKKKQKLRNDDDDISDHESDVEDDDEEGDSLQGEQAATAAAAVSTALSATTEIVGHEDDEYYYEYDEKAVAAAQRLTKTSAQLRRLFGRKNRGEGNDDDDDDDDDDELGRNDNGDDDEAMTVRKPPPSGASSVGATATTTATTATSAAVATNNTTAAATVADDDTDKEKAAAAAAAATTRATTSTRKRSVVMSEEEKLRHAQQRHTKLERCREWNYVRHRWRDRKVDLRHEMDVGKAIHRTIARLQQEQLEQQQQQQQAKEEEQPAAAAAAAAGQPPSPNAAAAKDDDDLNSTDDEQELLLNRLLQGNAHARQQQQATGGDGSNNSHDIVQPDTIASTLAAPYAQRGLDYWEMGNTRPRPQKFAYIRYVPTYKERIVNKPDKKKRTRTTNGAQQQQQHVSNVVAAQRKNAAYEAENDRLGFYSFPSTTATTMPLEKFHAWPLSHPSRNNARVGPEHGWFFHRRLVLRLAARQLVGAPINNNNNNNNNNNHNDAATTTTSMSSSINNRMIRALWNTKLADSHRQSLLLSQAQNAGVRMEAFLTHVWKDRIMAANLLGVSTAASSSLRIDEEQRGQAAIMAGLPVAMMGTTLRPYTSQCKSYIERLVRQGSTGQRIEWEPNAEPGSITQKKKGRQQFSAVSSYIPTPGTVPPIPSFPLDETQCIFGPIDKNAAAQHASYFTDGQEIPTVDYTVYRLTLSTLLARWATAIAAPPSAATAARAATTSNSNNFLLDDDDDMGIDGNDQKKDDYIFMVQDQIERMVQQTVDLNKNNKYKRLGPLSWIDDAEDGLPLVPLYRAMLGYCSLEASGYREQQGSNNSNNSNHWDDDNEYSDHDDDSYSRRKENERNNRVTLRNIAHDTIHFCEKHREHNGLLSFPKLHMILTLLGLSTELPESGVEILAQPLDEMHHQTPFDIMRSLLEHLEEEEFISNNVAILEFAVYQAAERLGRCVQKDPAQVSYHTWHLGTLAGCLLLCSGNRIGSGARRFPSSLPASSSSLAGASSNHRFRRSLGGDSNAENDSPLHEVRRKLPKFHELRLETARAFKLLLQLTKYQQSPRCNLAVASFLEWREVIALMLGPPSFVDLYYDPFDDIRALHSRHFNDLILSGQVPSAVLTEFQRRLSRKRSNRDCRLSFLANTLERDPGRLKSWRALVRALGPVGVQVDPARRESCAECQECRHVHMNLNVDHEKCNSDRDWAKNRIDWWDAHLLHVPKQRHGQNIETAKFCSIVESELGSISVGEQSDGAGDEDETDVSAPSLKWLEEIIASNLFAIPDAPTPSAEDREQVYDMDLPVSLLESSHDDSDSESDTSRDGDDISPMNPFPLDDGAAVENEVLCYKLTVACHMYGLLHPLVDRILVSLLNECWDEVQEELRTDCTAWTCISWIYSWVGVDVLAPIRKKLSSQPYINAAVAGDRPTGALDKRPCVKNIGDTAYPTVMCDAVREGIQLFGFKKWINIHRHFPDIFVGCGPRKAQKCYTYMVKNGLIEKIDDVPYPAAMCEAVQNGIEMYGLKWTKIQRHFPDIFEGQYLRKAYECYKHMIKKGLIQPMQIDESDTVSFGGDVFDDDDVDDAAAVHADELISFEGPVGVERAPDITTNAPELEREAMRSTPEALNKQHQAPSSEPQPPTTVAEPNSSSEAASALIALAARPASTATAANTVPVPTTSPAAPIPTNGNELERETKRIMQEILKNTVSTGLPARAPKRRKSKKNTPGVERTIEDFELESMRIMQQASQKWFPGYKPPGNLHQHVMPRRSSEPQPRAQAQLPPDPVEKPPVALARPPPSVRTRTHIANDSGKPLSRSGNEPVRKVTRVASVARKEAPPVRRTSSTSEPGPTLGCSAPIDSNEELDREAARIIHQVSQQMQSPGYAPMPDIADEAMRIVQETRNQQKKAPPPPPRQSKSASRKAATPKRKRDRSTESETEDTQSKTPRRSQQPALSAKPQLSVRRASCKSKKADDDDDDNHQDLGNGTADRAAAKTCEAFSASGVPDKSGPSSDSHSTAGYAEV